MNFDASCMFGKETQLIAVNTHEYNPTKYLCLTHHKAKNNTSLNIFHKVYFQWNEDGLELIYICVTNWLIGKLMQINSVNFMISDNSHVMKVSSSIEFDLQFKTDAGH